MDSASTFLLTMAGIAQPISYKKEEIPSSDNDSMAIINQLLVDNPDINAASFLNLLKSKGIQFSIPVQKEADTSSSFPQALRQDVVKQKESVGAKFQLKFIEQNSSPQDKSVGFTKFRVVMLAEGMGNLKDAFYYSKEAIQSAIPIFEGKKIFADHETELEAEQRPERSVKDIIGHFENVHVEENDGQALLVADVIIPPDEPFLWARSLMGHAVEYSKKFPGQEFIGLSINATGSADEKPIDEVRKIAPKQAQIKLDEAKSNGIDIVRFVSKIEDAFSCDLVTEAGAGGKVLSFIERNKKMDEKKEQAQDHSDEQQDIELIKKMISKYMGDGPEASPEECNMTKEAYEAYKEMGVKEEEAEEKAVSALKLSRHMASKKKESEEAEAKKEAEEKKESDEKDPSKLAPESEKAIESLRAEILKLKGELSKFHESQKENELVNYIDKKCKESKLSVDVTKKFKESLGKVKSKEQIDTMWKVFIEGYNSQPSKPKIDWAYVTTPEKETLVERKSKFDFSGITKD